MSTTSTESAELIQWPRAKYWDKAWNPIVGCHRTASPACDNCYARAWALRFGQSFTPHLSTHCRVPKTGVVFCGNMTDLFGPWLTTMASWNYIYACRLTDVNRKATYLWLTKRPSRMGEACRTYVETSRHWFGFTGENQEFFNSRLDGMCRHMPLGMNLWASVEPLLGFVDLMACDPVQLGRLGWIVVGCESGPKRRPCPLEWVERLVAQCRDLRIPVFVKQLDIDGKCVVDIEKFPEHLRIRQVPWAKEDTEEAEEEQT